MVSGKDESEHPQSADDSSSMLTSKRLADRKGKPEVPMSESRTALTAVEPGHNY